MYGTTHLTVSYFDGWTAVAVEDFGAASGGKQLVFRHTSGDLITWQLDDTYTRSANIDFVSGDDTSGINTKEAAFGVDFDDDSDIGL